MTRPSRADLLVPPDTEQRLTAIAVEHKALTERAACIEEAAYLMGITPVAVECLIRSGDLAVDPERGPRGARYIPRSSIDAAMRRTGWPATRCPCSPVAPAWPLHRDVDHHKWVLQPNSEPTGKHRLTQRPPRHQWRT